MCIHIGQPIVRILAVLVSVQWSMPLNYNRIAVI